MVEESGNEFQFHVVGLSLFIYNVCDIEMSMMNETLVRKKTETIRSSNKTKCCCSMKNGLNSTNKK